MKSVYCGSLTPSELGSFQYMKHFRFRRTCIKDRSGWGWAGSFVPGLGTVEVDEKVAVVVADEVVESMATIEAAETEAEAVESMAAMAADESVAAVESMAAVAVDEVDEEAVESMAAVVVDETVESMAAMVADTFQIT